MYVCILINLYPVYMLLMNNTDIYIYIYFISKVKYRYRMDFSLVDPILRYFNLSDKMNPESPLLS